MESEKDEKKPSLKFQESDLIRNDKISRFFLL